MHALFDGTIHGAFDFEKIAPRMEKLSSNLPRIELYHVVSRRLIFISFLIFSQHFRARIGIENCLRFESLDYDIEIRRKTFANFREIQIEA